MYFSAPVLINVPVDDPTGRHQEYYREVRRPGRVTNRADVTFRISSLKLKLVKLRGAGGFCQFPPGYYRILCDGVHNAGRGREKKDEYYLDILLYDDQNVMESDPTQRPLA